MPWIFPNIFAVELLISLLFFVIYQPRRKKFILRAALALFAFFLLASMGSLLLFLFDRNIFSFGGVYYFCVAFFLVLAVWFTFEINFWGALYLVTTAYAVQHTGYAAGKIIRTLTDIVLSAWLDVLVVDFFVYVVVGSIVFFTVVHPRRRNFNENLQNKRALVCSLVFLVLCVMLNAWAESIFVLHKEPFARQLRLCCCLYSVLGCTFTLAVQFGFIRVSRLTAEKDTLNSLLQSEKKQHALSEEAIDNLNAKSHDLKNQIAMLATIDDKAARQDYIEDIRKSVSAYDGAAATGNVALDIIVSEKYLLCEKHGISFSYLIDGKKLSFMSAADVATLFGNALDNAVECELKEGAEKRIISVAVKEDRGFVCIHIDNYCSKKPKFSNGLPQTTKEDKRNHGYGTKSIRNVVLKYGGKLCLEVRDERFCLDVFFSVAARQI